MDFRQRLAAAGTRDALALVRDLVADPPPWAGGWKVFGALWAMPGHVARLAYEAVDAELVHGETFDELTPEQRGRLVGWLDERARG